MPGTRVRAGAVLARISPRSDDLHDAAGLRAALVDAAITEGEPLVIEGIQRLRDGRAVTVHPVAAAGS